MRDGASEIEISYDQSGEIKSQVRQPNCNIRQDLGAIVGLGINGGAVLMLERDHHGAMGGKL